MLPGFPLLAVIPLQVHHFRESSIAAGNKADPMPRKSLMQTIHFRPIHEPYSLETHYSLTIAIGCLSYADDYELFPSVYMYIVKYLRV